MDLRSNEIDFLGCKRENEVDEERFPRLLEKKGGRLRAIQFGVLVLPTAERERESALISNESYFLGIAYGREKVSANESDRFGHENEKGGPRLLDCC